MQRKKVWMRHFFHMSRHISMYSSDADWNFVKFLEMPVQWAEVIQENLWHFPKPEKIQSFTPIQVNMPLTWKWPPAPCSPTSKDKPAWNLKRWRRLKSVPLPK